MSADTGPPAIPHSSSDGIRESVRATLWTALLSVVMLSGATCGLACPPLPGPLKADRGWVADLLEPACDLRVHLVAAFETRDA